MFVNKNYTYNKLCFLKSNSALNDPKRVTRRKTNQPTNQPTNQSTKIIQMHKLEMSNSCI